jgi:hypothetical protein
MASALLFAGLLLTSMLARDDTGAVRIPLLVSFTSPEGLDRLARATARSDFAPLANQFEAQVTIAFCGPTSAAIVLNALDPQGMGAPRDRSRLIPADALYLPTDLELTVGRHTQESVIAAGKKTRAQVFGEPAMINGKLFRDGGYQLRQLDELLLAHKIRTRLVIADGQTAEAEIRRDLIDNLNRAGDFVIVNYHRGAVGQTGGGHISPLGAYDAASDSVLILDVNPSRHPWVWMPLATLIQGMRTRDVVENRGYILVRSQ